MSDLWSNPLFGLALSILAYLFGLLIFRRFPHPLTTPLLIAAVLVIAFLKLTGISYKDYYVGGSYLNNLIVPSTVALGIPLYKTFHLMKHHARSILIGTFAAVVVNTCFTALMAKFFGMDFFLAVSLFRICHNGHGCRYHRQAARDCYSDISGGGCDGHSDQCVRTNAS